MISPENASMHMTSSLVQQSCTPTSVGFDLQKGCTHTKIYSALGPITSRNVTFRCRSYIPSASNLDRIEMLKQAMERNCNGME
jgi:hypothetical protein